VIVSIPDRGPFPAIHPLEAMAMPIAGKRTGILTLRSGPRWHDINYLDGRANRVESSSAEESLPMLLAERGTLPKAMAEEVIARVREGKGNPMDDLLERGVITNDKMEGLLRWRTSVLIERAATWTEGTFSFRQLFDSNAASGTPLTIKLPQLMFLAALKVGDEADIHRRLTPYLAAKPHMAKEPPAGLDQFGLKKPDLSLLRRLNGGSTLQDVLDDPPVPINRALKLIWLLISTGVFLAEEAAAEPAGAEMSPQPEATQPEATQPAADTAAPAAFAVGLDGSTTSDKIPTIPPPDGDAPTDDEELQSSPGSAEDRVTSLGKSLFGNDFDLAESARDALANAPEPPPKPEPEPEPEVTEDYGDQDESTLDDADRTFLEELEQTLERMENQNYLQVLGIGEDANSTDVRQAYFALAKQYHPDHFTARPGPIRKLVNGIFTRIGESHTAIEGDKARQAYIDKVIYGKKDPQEVAMEQARRLMDAEAAYKMGKSLLYRGQSVDAHNKFKEACNGDPEEQEYHCYYGYSTFMLAGNDAEAAQRGFDMMTEAANASKNADHYHLLAKAAIKMGKDQVALELLRRVLRRQRTNEEAAKEYRACEMRVEKARQKGQGGLSGLLARFRK
jgi:hypothetical protein